MKVILGVSSVIITNSKKDLKGIGSVTSAALFIGPSFEPASPLTVAIETYSHSQTVDVIDAVCRPVAAAV